MVQQRMQWFMGSSNLGLLQLNSPWVEVVQRAALHGKVPCSVGPGHGLEVLFSVGLPFSSL